MNTEAADDIFESIHSVMHLYRSLQYRTLRDGPYALTHMEFKVLNFFARHPGATQRDLASRTGRDKAQIARLIKSLKERTFLEGVLDAADRRSIRLHLTAAGKTVQAAVEAQGQHLSAVAIKGLSDDESRQLAALLSRVRADLDAEK